MIEDISNEILSRFALYMRIEPRCRRDDFQQGIEARSADPLWYLARQWQMGEFQGEDNGSPIRVSVDYHNQLISRLHIEGNPDIELPVSPPLETLIEQEPVIMNWRLRIRIGQQFERFVKQTLPDQANEIIITYRKPGYYPVNMPDEDSPEYIKTDRSTRRYLNLMAGRAINGENLINDILDNRNKSLPEELAGNNTLLKEVHDKLKEWYLAMYAQPSTSNPAWIPHEMNYQFCLTAENGDASQTATLSVPDYRNGELDWYSCELKSSSEVHEDLSVETKTFNPTRVEFAGKPNERWWTFEDHSVDFGKMDVGTTDLVRTMLMEYAFIYADDWCIVPLDVPVGSLTRIMNLRVKNVFGDEDSIRFAAETNSSPLDVWDLYKLKGDKQPPKDPDVINPVSHLLMIPPAINYRQESEAIEEVRFIRDEGANLVFAIENTVSNQMGTPVKGFELQLEKYNRQKEPLITQFKNRIIPLEVEKAALEDERATLNEELQTEGIVATRIEQINIRKQVIQERITIIDDSVSKYQRNIDILENPNKSIDVNGLPLYRLANTVPDNWIPYVPVNKSGSRNPLAGDMSIRLRQAQMLRNVDRMTLITNNPGIDLAATEHMQIDSIAPMSRILAGMKEDENLEWLNEEAVLRSGLKVQITKQRVRWFDGKTYVWLGRKVLTGRGEGSSGLSFDNVFNL